MKSISNRFPGALPAFALAAALAVALAAAPTASAVHAQDRTRLTVSNFVDVGDVVTDVVSTSGLAFSTMMIFLSATEHPMSQLAVARAPATTPAAQTFESPCPDGGRVKVTMRDPDGSNDLSRGDGVVTSFESCMMDGTLVTGRSEFLVAAHRFEGLVEITEINFRFTNLGTPQLRWSGPARVVLRSDLQRGTDHFLVTYQDLAVNREQGRMRWNFTLDVTRPPIGDQVASLRGAMSVGKLHLRLQQDEPFMIPGDGFPRTGQLTARDEAGSRLQVEAGRWRYAYRWFRADNRGETPDSTSHSKSRNQR